MGKALGAKLKEALISVLPVSLIVALIYFTPLVSLTNTELVVFLISTLVLILGIGLFNLGADMAMTPMGDHIGSGLTRTGSLTLLMVVCFLMGLFITIAEPDLTVLAAQVRDVINETVLVASVGIGVGVFLLLSLLKIVFRKNLSSMLMFFYMLLFALASLVVIGGNEDFLAIAFDSGGVTTGPITVPFIMALGVGIATTLGGKNASENSFGLIAMCSIGPVLAVMILGIGADGALTYRVPDYSVEANLGSGFLTTLIGIVKEVGIALGLIVIFFMVLQVIYLKLPKKTLGRIAVGIVYTFLGLVIFLTAVTIGFMPVGYRLGVELSSNAPVVLVIFGFIIGLVTVLAEPAVHVLNKQVEEVTGGTVSKGSMMLALSIGVGISIGLSMLRIILGFNILYYLIPGYFISLGLSFFVPGLYTAIAFDSGGVASGPLTSSFILPFAVGACAAISGEASVLTDAFGIVAMVAMTPLITIQLLGFKAVMQRRFSERMAMRHMLEADDEQVIEFM
ncbi:MAG: DUF1538 domain-containing protein [Clostridiales bacterium]|nr:DUF1538 domain-containing protein [Clostridiales bacterium]